MLKNVTRIEYIPTAASIVATPTIDLIGNSHDVITVTGNGTTTAFSMAVGQRVKLVAADSWKLVYNETLCNISGYAEYTCSPGDRLDVFKEESGTVRVQITRQDGAATQPTNIDGGSGVFSGNFYWGNASLALPFDSLVSEDASPQANHISYSNVTIDSDPLAFGGMSASFSRSAASNIVVGNTGSFDVLHQTREWTVRFFIDRTTDSGSDEIIFYTGEPGGSDIGVFCSMTSTGNIRFAVLNGAGSVVDFTSSSPVGLGRTHIQIVSITDGSEYRIFQDGVLTGTGAASAIHSASPLHTNALTIGGAGFSTFLALDAKLDDFWVYSDITLNSAGFPVPLYAEKIGAFNYGGVVIRNRRVTSADLAEFSNLSRLTPGTIYLVTDTGRLAVSISETEYHEFSLSDHNHDLAYDALGSASAAVVSALETIRGGVAADGDTLFKLRAMIQAIQDILTSDNLNLDTLQEIVDFIEAHQGDIDSLLSTKVNISDIVNTLIDTSTDKPLSAAQGKALKDLIDALDIVVQGKEAAITAGTVSQYFRGDKAWSDLPSAVRAVLLAGLSTIVNSEITAADSILTAFGKLQAQITSHNSNVENPHATTALQVGADTAGTAAALMVSHVSNSDPHTQYALESSLGTAASRNVGTTTGTVAAGDDSRIVNAVQTTRTITAGSGLSGGGDLSADRTISVNFGTTTGTVAAGDDSRMTNSREWTASTVTQSEAETGTATTRRAWTAQRVRQAIDIMLSLTSVASKTPKADASGKIDTGWLKVGTTTGTVAAGDDSRIVNAVQTTRTITAGSGLSGGGNLSADRVLAVNFGTTAGTVAAGDDSRIVNAVQTTRTITAGTGLSGGGNLSADRSISVNFGTTLGTVAEGNDSRIVNAVQTTRTITAGTGLSGGGNLSADRSISVVYGSVAGTSAEGNDSRIVNAVQTTRTITAGTGLSGGGDLTADRTISVLYGSTAGTSAEGNDSRLSDSREWSASTITQALAEGGIDTARYAWTSERVRQATNAWWNSISSISGKTLSTSSLSVSATSTTSIASSTATVLKVERTGSTANSVIELKTTAGSMFIGNPDGTSLAIDDDNDLSAAPLFRIASDGSTVINASSASDGLRINQTGSGNAFVVEDSASPDSTPFVITTSGQVLIGATTARNIGVSPALIIEGLGSSSSTMAFIRNSADSSPATMRGVKSRGTSNGAVTAVGSSDNILQFIAYGTDGTSEVQASTLYFAVDGTVSTGIVPGKIVMSTASSAGAVTEALRVDSTQTLVLTSGKMRIASGAGATKLLQSDASGNASWGPAVGQSDSALPTNSDIRSYYGNKYKPPIKPTLEIDWENSYYSIYDASTNRRFATETWDSFATELGADLTITRAGEQTYFDALGVMRVAAANTLQCDHDPLTGQRLGPYIGGARTNYTKYSADYTQWTLTDSTLEADTWVAPDGSTARIWLANTNASPHRLSRTSVSTTVGTSSVSYGWYVYIPPGSDVIRLYLRARSLAGGSSSGQLGVLSVTGSGASASLAFLSSTPFGTTPPAAITASNVTIQSISPGVFRIGITSAVSSDATATLSSMDLSWSSGTGENAAGTVNTRLGVWGWQYEIGGSLSPYIPVPTDVAVTRPATTVTIGGSKFNGFYNKSEGSFRTKASRGSVSASQGYLLTVSDGTTSNYIARRLTQSGSDVITAAAGTLQVNSSDISGVTQDRMALGYKENDFIVNDNGTQTTVSTMTPPVVTRINLGSGMTNNAHWENFIQSISFCPRKFNTTVYAELYK